MNEARSAERFDALCRRLQEAPSLLVAFSGGADSTFLLATALKEVPGRVLAVTARSAAHPAREIENAEVTAHILGAEHRVVATAETDDPNFRANGPERCYHCKCSLLGDFLELAREEKLAAVADGTTADELLGYRPGARAAAELGVLSPLAEAGLTKEDVRLLARENGVPNFDRPPTACLATRFPCGEEITPEKLRIIEDAEQTLADLGFRQIRCRYHGETARVEVGPKEVARAAVPEVRRYLVARLHQLGFKYVTLDLDGYRTGSMDAPKENPHGS